MLPEKYRWIEAQFEPEGDPALLLAIGRELADQGNLEGAATVLDRAYGLDPGLEEVRRARADVLNALSVVEYGLTFRYVPGGVFLMGSWYGEPDERPVHPVWLWPYRLSETPVSWAAYCRLMDWEAPPVGMPPQTGEENPEFDRPRFHLHEATKIRLQYCEDRTTRARDWHSHDPRRHWQGGGRTQTGPEAFGAPPRDDPGAPWTYENKPMIAVAWQEAEELALRLSAGGVRYALPTEAQWEKAARGGLTGARYPWGDRRPTAEQCDFDRYHQYSIRPMRAFPPNGYGLYAVSGCVWEWVRDWYDREWYAASPNTDPDGPPQGQEKVLRGGSWTDGPEVVTVSFRMSRESRGWREGTWGGHLAPNIGFRLCRYEPRAGDGSDVR
jgi:formylglycine-generating enzyme required for sulfatase activity